MGYGRLVTAHEPDRLADIDPDVAGLIGREAERRASTIDLIASESEP